jgi:hypothetical protein
MHVSRQVSPNRQLQRTVARRRGRVARAPFHYAHAPRFTPQRAAAEPGRSAFPVDDFGIDSARREA